jgi:hypothetical protein
LILLAKSFKFFDECPLADELAPGEYCEDGYLGWETDTNADGVYTFSNVGNFCGLDFELKVSLAGYIDQTLNPSIPCWSNNFLDRYIDPNS